MSAEPPVSLPNDPIQPSAAPASGRRGWRIRAVVSALMMASMAVMAAFLIAVGLLATETRLVQDADRDAQHVAQLLAARTRAWLAPTTAALRQLAQSELPRTVPVEARLRAVRPLVDELDAEPLLASVYLGWDDGDFLLVRPLRDATSRQRFMAPADAQVLVQSVERDAQGQQQHRYLFLDRTGLVVEERAQPDTAFDPRTRPWYDAANDPQRTVQSAPYAFFTTGELGISLSRRSADGHAVVGMDITLSALAGTLTEQRSLPATRMALVDGGGRVLAAADLPAGDRAAARQWRVAELETPALEQLWRLPDGTAQAVTLDVDGARWVGVRMPTALGLGQGNVLLVATPFDALVAPARARVRTVMLMAAVLALLLMPLGWWGGRALGHTLRGLRSNTARLVRFDFQQEAVPPSGLREVNELAAALAQMRVTIEAFLHLSQRMATEPELGRMLEEVLAQLVRAMHAQAARVYLFHLDTGTMTRTADAGDLQTAMPEHFAHDGQRSSRQAGRRLGLQGQHLDLELRGRDGHLRGLLVLEVRTDDGHEDPAFVAFAQQLSGMLAVAIETRELIHAQRQLFDAVIQLMAGAIDAKSPYTGGHCDRVPQLATAFMDRLCQERSGPYADVQRTEGERYAFRLGAWLHDCGKVVSPEHIVDKATKLELIHNRIHEVRTRFEVLWRDAEIAHLQRLIAGDAKDASEAQRDAEQQALRDDFAFVAACNQGGEFMSDEALARLRDVASRTWLRHFDRHLGLSVDEAHRLASHTGGSEALPAREALLADRPEHVVPWGQLRPAVERDDPRNEHGFDMSLPPQQQHQGELHNLSVQRGTLTAEDRFKINEHIVQTYVMLKRLPWPQELKQVPDMAATHHERLDGQGYPRRLPAERLTLEDRVMALADVFEALTAADRPYKPAKSLTESLRIMAFMVRDGHLDAELFRYFLRSRLWEDFALRFLRPAQCDAVDLDAIEALLPPP